MSQNQRMADSETQRTQGNGHLREMDEETDPLSTLSSSLSLLFQIASTSLYRLSSSTHLQLHPSIPPHVHSSQPTASALNSSNANAAGQSQPAAAPGVSSSGLIPPNEMIEDVKELVEDFMDRVGSMKEGIEGLQVSRPDEDHLKRVKELDDEIRVVNDEYEECVKEAKLLQKQVEALLDQSCP